ncbi:hypothetical protein MOV08_31390 [Streptomyces yunnanensis]|uniref:Uncharacterized protein n=1 Tax=Streptomyces yunnanensis TaxID=156453 RepID=A0ABY8AEG8_9ACTN|nr:hypothetical protein [Streptomyces yunnanensis]WEB43333.1 hypothetical protein MOV08_31390 [Streptomyces yunnanensis]
MADPTNGPAQAAPDTPDAAPEPAPRQAPEAAAAPEAPEAVEPAEPAGPRPLGLAVTPTGQAAVDGGLRRLTEADHLPVSGHLDMYEDVHRGLRDVLAGLDQHPGPPVPSPSPTHDRPGRPGRLEQ